MPRFLQILPLLISLPCTAATVYKSVDARGRITFSDLPPAQAVSVEKLVVKVPAAAAPDLYLQRLAAMTEVTDKIAADRQQREQTRAQSRRRPQDDYRTGAPGVMQGGYYVGYAGYGGGEYPYYREHHYPSHPIAHPPRQPARGPALVDQYPASLVRRSYDPRVAAVFQNHPAH